MSYYWARFEQSEGHLFRYDTRIYLTKINKPSEYDRCIGAVVGKNPGSAQPSDINNSSLQKIDIGRDQLLPNVRTIIEKAFLCSGKVIAHNSYIQVLNLMYICNKDLDEAIKKYKGLLNPKICETEGKFFPFIWYVWGPKHKDLDKLKHRFTKISTNAHFYYDNFSEKFTIQYPNNNPARHTQGLRHDLVVPHMAKIV